MASSRRGSRASIALSNGGPADSRMSFDAPETTLPGVQQAGQAQPQMDTSVLQKTVDDVLYSDIGVSTLLNRLKQSVATAKDFATFLKKRSSLEEEHAQGLKRLCRSTHDSIRRGDTRQGSFSAQLSIMARSNERMADNGMQFALSLHQMHEDLTELSNNMERGRKHWKQLGLAAEKKVQDAELLMDKAKAKYDSLAEELDRVKTGDKGGGKLFGLKGPKSAAQQEEDLQRKVQATDADYQTKVQAAQSARRDLTATTRPQAVKSLQELITECDNATTLQVQKFVSFNEKLLLGNGMSIAPVSTPGNMEPIQPSLREVVMKIDNEVDFKNYIAAFSSKVPSRPNDAQYEKHPTLQSSQQTSPNANRHSMQPLQSQPPMAFNNSEQHLPYQSQRPPSQHQQQGQPPAFYPPPQQGGPQQQPPYQSFNKQPSAEFGGPPEPPQLGLPSTGTSHFPSSSLGQSGGPGPHGSMGHGHENGAPNPLFGISLDDLFLRDGSPVPMVVYQCIQGVEQFGLNTEGIYRASGTQAHIETLRKQFNNEPLKIDFKNPDSFMHDINNVAGVMKEFFRALPDPLLTHAHYDEFIEAARIDDDTVRRDSLHAVINALPDPNYATLRAVVLHLHRVQEFSQTNRMSATNLAICFAPTLMGQHRGQMADAGLQARVIDTILVNTYQIFDED